MYYDRKIKYFNYIKDGERLQGAGFVKLEVRGDSCKLRIQISGLHRTDTLSKQVCLVSGDKEEVLDFIELQGGKGILQMQLPVENLCSGISYGELQAIRIPIAVGVELYCRVGEVTERQNKDTMAYEADVISQAELSVEENSSEEEIFPEAEEIGKLSPQAEKMEAVEEPARQRMLSTKWGQLSAIYPHVQPFEDDRDYLRIGPEDFVVLGRQSYQLVHNSFLLHGYYNYKHLILARHDWRNEERYYVGVPGNFYEREKQVALMFGFESFECGEEPANMGDYGYYMIRVDV